MDLIQLKNKQGNPLVPKTVAEGVSFDSNDSGLEATTVQDAITETNNKWRIKITSETNNSENESGNNSGNEQGGNNSGNSGETSYEGNALDSYVSPEKAYDLTDIAGSNAGTEASLGILWENNKHYVLLKPNSTYTLTLIGVMKTVHVIYTWIQNPETNDSAITRSWTEGNGFTKSTYNSMSSGWGNNGSNSTFTVLISNTANKEVAFTVVLDVNSNITSTISATLINTNPSDSSGDEPGGGENPIEPESGGGGTTPSEPQYIEYDVEKVLEEVDRRIEAHTSSPSYSPSVQTSATASDISFDSSTNSLSYNTVQGAIEQVNSKVDLIETSSPSVDVYERLNNECKFRNATNNTLSYRKPYAMTQNVGEKFSQNNGNSTDYSRNFYKVESGDKLKFTFTPCPSDSYAYYIIGANDRIIKAGEQPAGGSFNEEIIEIPSGAEVFIFNYEISSGQQVFIKRNKDNSLTKDAMFKESDLVAMSETRDKKDNAKHKKFTLAWISDTHGDERNYRRFVEYVNSHTGIIDGALHTGDMNRMSDTDNAFENTIQKYRTIVPFMPVMGNHDSHGSKRGSNDSSYYEVYSSGSSTYQASKYVTPFQNLSGFVQGTRNDSITGNIGLECYFYKDFNEYKVRVICLHDYDLPRIVNTNNWVTTIDSTEIGNAIPWEEGHTYNIGSVINYKGLYLKCLVNNSVLINDGDYNSTYKDIQPWSATSSDGRYYQQDQINFLIQSLRDLPSDEWGVVIATHMPVENYAGSTYIADNSWHDKNAEFITKGATYLQAQDTSYVDRKYLLSDILAAFTGRKVIENRIFKTMIYPKTNLGTSSVNYITPPTNGIPVSGSGDSGYWYPDITVNADFSNAKGHIICCLNGHTHNCGCYWLKYTVAPNTHLPFGAYANDSDSNNPYKILNINQETGCYIPDSLQEVESSNIIRYNVSDIIRGGSLAQDCFNVLSYDNVTHEIQLLRIGADTTDKHVKRDYARITIPVTQGTTSNRPTLTTTDSGYTYYDMSLKKIIKWNGTDWINLDGTSL